MPIDVIVPYSSDYTPKWMLERLQDDISGQTVPTNLMIIDETEADDVAEARNLGLSRSDNRFVAFADADDRWEESKLEKQLDAITNAESALCLTQTLSDGKPNTRPTDDVQQFVKDVVLRHTVSFTSSILVDTNRTNIRFDEKIYRREDHLFAIEAATDEGVYFVNEPLVTVEKHSDGLSATGDPAKQLQSHHRLFNRGKELLPELDDHAEEYWAEIYHRVGRSYYYTGEYPKSLEYLARSIWQKPQPKSIGAFVVSTICLARERMYL
jgi:glycosyltransferase involved in cell wall biosynthesis